METVSLFIAGALEMGETSPTRHHPPANPSS